MALGSVFTLVSNDGKTDKILAATHILDDRLKKSREAKLFACITNYEKYFENDASPFSVAEATQFYDDPKSFCESREIKSIHPTLWDITRTHNIFMNKFYKPFVATSHVYSRNTNRKGLQQFGKSITFTLNKNGSWFADMALHVKMSGLKSNNFPDKCKYASFPGHRLIKKVTFSVNGNILDSYITEDINRFYQYDVPPNKKSSWLRAVGQEVPHQGYITPDNRNNEFRELRWISDGAQTLKSSHDDVEMIIPLIFWFNEVSQAFPNCMIDWGQVDVTIDLAPASEMFGGVNYGGGGSITPPTIDVFDLYVNHIESLPQVVNIYTSNFSYSLIRIHRNSILDVDLPTNDIWLQELKYPVESLTITFRPIVNLEGPEHLDNWYLSTKLTDILIKQPVITDSPVVNTLAINTIEYHKEEQVVDTLSFRIKDNEIFGIYPGILYQDYIPFRHGKFINAPEWLGWYLMPFNFNPGDYNPSGHFNASKMREMYLRYSSKHINPENPARMTVLAQTINFLLIKNGSSILRYTT
jgi:hypothetical protein